MKNLRKLAEDKMDEFDEKHPYDSKNKNSYIYSREEALELMLSFHEQASEDMIEREFVKWVLAEDIFYEDGIINYERAGKWFRTFDELYQYWQINIKNK